MKPIYDNPFAIPVDTHLEMAKEEIKLFMDCDAKYAEVPVFSQCSFSTSKEKYKKALRVLRINNVSVRQKKGNIILAKE